MCNHLPKSGWLASCTIAICLTTNVAGQSTNPISQIARLFDSQLVEVEDRVRWLESRLGTLAKAQEHPLKTSLGYRGGRMKHDDPLPSITLDLGEVYALNTIFLVPAQPEFREDPGMFPLRILLECSDKADFSTSTLIHRTLGKSETNSQSAPNAYNTNASGRYVRLIVEEGVHRGGAELFSLSEFAVVSNGEPVSFAAQVSTVGELQVEGIWHPEALVDGRTPFGTWHIGNQPPHSTGDAIFVNDPSIHTSWSIDLRQAAPIDRIVFFPYEINRSFDTFVFPESIRVTLLNDGVETTTRNWKNPLPGGSHLTPLIINLQRTPADQVIITADRPWTMGDQMIHAFSEIEIWSKSKNLAANRIFKREHRGIEENVSNLSDGYSSLLKIIHVSSWLQQLYERQQIEAELVKLKPVYLSIQDRSELNAAWGSAVALGLTFLIPVFIVERRRLTSKEQLTIIRKRIASDLHDDIGSNLGSISLIARSARKDLVRLRGPEVIAHDLTEVESIARESSLAMRDIVWLLERNQDTIGDLFQRMRETANRLLREIEFTLECDSTKTASRLSLDAKRHLFLFYKEAIHNVLKHAKATRVTIRIWDEDDKLALEVSDNGVGFQAKPNVPIFHAEKLDERARVLGAELQITSSKQSGTCIRLLVKRSLLTNQQPPPS